jgi:hypothetical protein
MKEKTCRTFAEMRRTALFAHLKIWTAKVYTVLCCSWNPEKPYNACVSVTPVGKNKGRARRPSKYSDEDEI